MMWLQKPNTVYNIYSLRRERQKKGWLCTKHIFYLFEDLCNCVTFFLNNNRFHYSTYYSVLLSLKWKKKSRCKKCWNDLKRLFSHFNTTSFKSRTCSVKLFKFGLLEQIPVVPEWWMRVVCVYSVCVFCKLATCNRCPHQVMLDRRQFEHGPVATRQ